MEVNSTLTRCSIWLGSFRVAFRLALVAALVGGACSIALAQSVAFWRAVEANDVQALRAEIRRGADPNARHAEHGPAIVVAARSKSFDVVRALASLDATEVDAANAADETALMLVSTLGDQRSVDVLIQRGAQVNRPGWTPLHYAASGAHVEIVRALLEHHAFIDAQSANKTSPLMLAARMRALPVVQLLIDQGADPSLRNDAGLDAAAYLDRIGERAWATWMRERVRQYVARFGTVDQPKWTAPVDSPVASDSSDSLRQDMGPVPLSREVSVAPESIPPPRPGLKGGSGSAAAAQPSSSVRPSGVAAATPSTASQQGAATRSAPPAVPAKAADRSGAASASSTNQATSGAAAVAPRPASGSASSAATATSASQAARAAPGTAGVSATSSPTAAVKSPQGSGSLAPAAAAVAGGSQTSASRSEGKREAVTSSAAAAPSRAADSEPLFFSRTLSLPVDPPSQTGSAGAPGR